MSARQKPAISIIIPALNEADSLGSMLEAVSHLSDCFEIIIADGGSVDGTCEIARQRGVKVIKSERGRGAQMHRGACAARGDIFWFIHADTIVPVNALEQITVSLCARDAVAGNFDVCFDGPGWAPRFMTWLYPKLRRIGLCYGDSAIFVRRGSYEEVGGFKSLPIFEDLDLLERLRTLGRIVQAHATVVTSSRRFQGCRFPFTFMRWIVMQALYWWGISPHSLARFYGRQFDKGLRRGVQVTSGLVGHNHNGEACSKNQA